MRSRARDCAGFQESQQVVGSRSVSVDRLQRGTQHLLVVFEPASLEFINSENLKSQQRRCPQFQLGVDLGGDLLGLFQIRTDLRTFPTSVFVIGEIPDFSAQITANFSHAKGCLFRH